jgi:hypothetical protein
VRLLLEALEDRTCPSFLAPVNCAVGPAPRAVAMGDFNGFQDLVVCSSTTDTVSVLLGNGKGTFQAAQTYTVGGAPQAVAVGDLNGDGKPDIVTANSNGTVTVLLGNGNGTFQPALKYTLPAQATGTQQPLSVAVGDFNKDGRLDVAVTGNTYTPGYSGLYGSSPGTFNGYVNVLIGNGAGGFSADNSFALPGGQPFAVAVGDFGNGNLDLAIAEWDLSAVTVLLGNGDGTFASPTNYATGVGPASVAVGDFNGDGKLDLVTANQGSNTVSVLLGSGTGTFGAAASFSTGTNPTSVAMADLNGDGKLDVVTTNATTNTLSVLLNNGKGGFWPNAVFAAGSSPAAVATGDFNGDGLPDVAVANSSSENVSVLLNTGSWPVLQVSGFPSPDTAGQAHTITVTATDAAGNRLTSFTGTVQLISSDGQATFADAATGAALTNNSYTFTAADAGQHQFIVDLKTAGIQAITASDSADWVAGFESPITVTSAAASKLVLTAPASIRAGVPFSLTVTAEDPYGNVATSYTGTVHFTTTAKPATLPANYTFTTTDGGVHTFSGLVLRKKGKQTITVTDTANGSLTASVTVQVS